MNLLNDIKKEIILSVVIIIVTTITFFSVTYAIYFTIDEKNIGTVSTATLGFDPCIDETCTDFGDYGTTIGGEIYPMNQAEGLAQDPYLFEMSYSGDDEISAKVYIATENNSGIDYSDVVLAAKVRGNNSYEYVDLTEPVTEVFDLYLEPDDSVVIEVYMWLDEEASNDMIGQTISVFINAVGYYTPSDPNNLHSGATIFANVDEEIVNGTTFSINAGNTSEEFTAPVTGYYYVKASQKNVGVGDVIGGGIASGYVYLIKGEKLYIRYFNSVTHIYYFATPPSSNDLSNAYIAILRAAPQSLESYSNPTNYNTFLISGRAGTQIPNSDGTVPSVPTTLHSSGKYFLAPKFEEATSSTPNGVFIRYAGIVPRVTTKLDNVRYVKDCVNGNSANSYNQWKEIKVIKNGENIAYGKTITGSVSQYSSTYKYAYIVDGVVADSNYGRSSSTGLRCVTIDLGSTYNVDEVAVWHVYSDGRTFYNHTTSVSSDNTNWTEIINSIESETIHGKRFTAY